jgi:C-terminal processing protease CtpA/Prc
MRNFCLVSVACICCLNLLSQETLPTYMIGVDLYGGKQSCPVFVGKVSKDSPAGKAGIEPGDHLVAVDGNPVQSLQDASRRIASNIPGRIVMQLERAEIPYIVTVTRETRANILRQNGKRLLNNGLVVDLDATEEQINQRLAVRRSLANTRDLVVIFPGHYPADKQLYYPGFEVFLWDRGNQVTVGGIEDSPASRSGVRWGDSIIAVNGVNPRSKSVSELESLFSNSTPTSMVLIIERAGVRKTFSFELARAASVLRDNHLQVINGKMVPLWVSKEYIHCFD